MIDRISKNYVHYTGYRQHMTSQLAINQSYEQRMNMDVVELNGRARHMTATSYPRVSMEASLIRSAEEANRIKELYSSMPALGYVAPQIDTLGMPYRGQNIDIVG